MTRVLRARGTTVALVAIIAVLAGTGGGYALAAGSATITACVSHKDGTLYEAKKCKKHDQKISWSQTGPAGPQGVQGQQGSQGQQGIQGLQGIQGTGDTGPAGPASTEVEAGTVTAVAGGSDGEATAACPSATVATGGGAATLSTDAYILTSAPNVSTGTPTGWEVYYENTSGSTIHVQAFAVCAPAG
jgi:hypothetical protein